MHVPGTTISSYQGTIEEGANAAGSLGGALHHRPMSSPSMTVHSAQDSDKKNQIKNQGTLFASRAKQHYANQACSAGSRW